MVGSDDATVVLDSGAVIGLARGDRRLRGALTAARKGGAEVVVPMVVVAETTRGNGPRDAPVNLVLAECGPPPELSEDVARRAGRLLASSKMNVTVDALVVAEAIERAPAVVLTSDPDDLRRLADGVGGVVIQPV